ncbi:MAG: uncharacterized protein HW390_1019 [Candidatus Brocadiaceae bacterium]|nr:uncharacterized protein [Candidatus Brocadiaceae bacterium]
MFKRVPLLSHSMLLLLFCVIAQTCIAQEDPDVNGIPGYKGMNVLKGNWRPFNNNSPWNKTIPAGINDHDDSEEIIKDMDPNHRNITLRFTNESNPTLHVVSSRAAKHQYKSSSNIYRFTHFNPQNCWNPDALGNDGNGDDITDEAWPFIPGVTYPEPPPDEHMIIIDKSAGANYTAYEVSNGNANLVGGYAPCSTFNIWNLGYRGYVYYRPPCGSGNPGSSGNQCATCDDYWHVAGGRGAGVPIIGGLIRPKELDNAVGAVLAPGDPNYNPDVASGDGLIHHALAFCYNFNRNGPPLYPLAYRNDGPMAPLLDDETRKYPIEGMLFQLKPSFDESNINNAFGLVIVHTLKTYGMVLVDNGSDNDTMALYLQNMYTPGVETNVHWWEQNYAGLYGSITGIKASDFRVVDTDALYGAGLLWEHVEP